MSFCGKIKLLGSATNNDVLFHGKTKMMGSGTNNDILFHGKIKLSDSDKSRNSGSGMNTKLWLSSPAWPIGAKPATNRNSGPGTI